MTEYTHAHRKHVYNLGCRKTNSPTEDTHTESKSDASPQLPSTPCPSLSFSNARVIGFCGCVKGLLQSNQEVLRSPCVGQRLNNPLTAEGRGGGLQLPKVLNKTRYAIRLCSSRHCGSDAPPKHL